MNSTETANRRVHAATEWPDLVGVSVVKEKVGVDARNRKTSRILCSLL
jgi:hypothetical protein